jgi:hypothetical protein
MDSTPTPHEADEALRRIRQQQAEAVRSAYDPGPWWTYLALAVFFVGYGLGHDLKSVWGDIFQTGSALIFLGAAIAQWRRRRAGRSATASSRMNDATTWIVTIALTATMLAVLFAGPPALTALGVPLPHVVCGLAVGLIVTAAIPLNDWSIRRVVARIESGQPPPRIRRVAPQLDTLLLPPTRVAIVALLASVTKAEYAFVRDNVSIDDAELAELGGPLEAAGYVTIRKGHVGKEPRAWFKLTPAGWKAFNGHVEALREIAAHSGAVIQP